MDSLRSLRACGGLSRSAESHDRSLRVEDDPSRPSVHGYSRTFGPAAKPYLKRASSRLTVEIVLFYGVSGSLAAMQNAHVLATVRREARMRRGQRGSRDGAEQFQSVTLRGRRLGQLLEFHAARFQSHAVAAERCQVLDEILEALYRPT